tara:strand:- start:264 stop:662 length:399 start_codon:yes stop_codon:yes gene_type:complete
MSSSDPLYHGTAWPLNEGEELTHDAAPIRNYASSGFYEGKVHATRNLNAAQFYARLASENSGFPVNPEPRVYTVEHTGTELENDPHGEWYGTDVRADKFTVSGRVPEEELTPWDEHSRDFTDDDVDLHPEGV